MSKITFTEEDVKSGQVVAIPGWHGFEITKLSEKPAKTDGSTVYYVQMRVLNGPDPKMLGCFVLKVFSEKAIGRAKSFFSALGGEVTAGATFDFDDSLKGMKLDGFLQRGKNETNGEDTNDIQTFRPFTESK